MEMNQFQYDDYHIPNITVKRKIKQLFIKAKKKNLSKKRENFKNLKEIPKTEKKKTNRFPFFYNNPYFFNFFFLL